MMLIEIRNRGETPIKFISIASNSTFFWVVGIYQVQSICNVTDEYCKA